MAHSLFVIVLLVAKREYKKPQGLWLLLFLGALLWLQAEFLSIRWPFDIGVDIFYGTRHGVWLLIGPLYFAYVKSITSGRIEKKELWSLLPFFVFTLIIPLVFNEMLSFRQVHYGMLTPFDNRPQEVNTIQYVYSCIFIFQFVYVGFFLYLASQQISSYKQNLKNNLSSFHLDELNWLRITWYGMISILIICTAFIALLFLFTTVYRRHFDYLYVLPISFLVYAISYKLSGVNWHRPEANGSDGSSKYEKSVLSNEQINEYKVAINTELSVNKLFLNQELRLNDLAKAIGISSHKLSQVLNQHMETSFFDLINSYRVEEAKKLIAQKPEITLLQVAFDAGFNNKTSFVNAFKKFEGTTPSRFVTTTGNTH